MDGAKTTDDEARQRDLFDTGSPHVLAALIANPHLCEDLQVRFAQGGAVGAGILLCQRGTLCAEAQLVMCKRMDESVLMSLARRHDLVEEAQVLLVKIPTLDVREALAENPSVGTGALAVLLKERKQPSILSALKRNDTKAWTDPSFPCHLLWEWDPQCVLAAAMGSDEEAVKALAPTWQGTVTELVEAIGLREPLSSPERLSYWGQPH